MLQRLKNLWMWLAEEPTPPPPRLKLVRMREDGALERVPAPSDQRLQLMWSKRRKESHG